ncbi:hypothetical protein M8312_05950 [Sphingomonas sp. KRR8]|uniref:hypothetical protein n=1 Tax=Sphingomonas sp. KRR8 TaxID=2942996 RepID=UPI002020F14D|nr:hypothetical protein [Sphingomonas sp. KRR8]URD62046.1 hypothetical protein M8312_05950 [Sphingomonas sp. KRR8]
MALPRIVRLALGLLVCAAGAYAAIYTTFGASWFRLGSRELAQVEGCYEVSGQRLFKVLGGTILTSNGTFGFEGAHEKDRDVLIVDGPIRVARHPHLTLEREGTLTKIPISYGQPMSLSLWDESNQPVEAHRIECH